MILADVLSPEFFEAATAAPESIVALPAFLIVDRCGAVLASRDNLSDALDVLKALAGAYLVVKSDGERMTRPRSSANTHVPDGVVVDPIDVEAA